MDRIYLTKKQTQQAGCIQFDPVGVCGRNADLVLQSRIKGYQKTMLVRKVTEQVKSDQCCQIGMRVILTIAFSEFCRALSKIFAKNFRIVTGAAKSHRQRDLGNRHITVL